MGANNEPYEAVEIYESVRDGVMFKITAVVMVGANMRQKSFWISQLKTKDLMTERAQKWTEAQKQELRAIYYDAIDRAAFVRDQQLRTIEYKTNEQRMRSKERLQRASRDIAYAMHTYGKGRAGYWTGYRNVYGNITDGDT